VLRDAIARASVRPQPDHQEVRRPAEGADYRIEVRRIGNQDEAPLPFMLSLSLR